MNTSKKSRAGKRSGIKRAKMARLRQLMVLRAFEDLKRAYQIQPFATESIDALQEGLRKPSRGAGLVLNLNSVSGKWETVGAPPKQKSDKYWALFEEVFDTLIEHGGDLASMSMKRETLIKDLKALGIKSSHRKERSG
jgi:hypothetical protein